MKEQRVTYADLKLAKDSKRPQVKPKGSKSSTTGTEQGVTYAELSLHNAARDPQENGKSWHLKGLASPPEKLIARILGLTCIVLICTIVPVWVISPCQCGPCPKGWFTYSNNCYYFSDEKNTWNESVTACQNKKSQLLYIDTEEEMKFMQSISVLSWIGVYRNGSNQTWTFINASTFQLDVSISLPAASPLPPGQIAAEVLGIVFLVLVSSVVKTVVLIPAATKEPEQYDFYSKQNECPNVTKSEKACHCGPCPKGWFTYFNNCYYFSDEKNTWNESVTACQDKNSQLLYIDTEEEMDKKTSTC
ncbi:NKG2-C type II integral membrane protein-like [Talpa occidentalis]|uniref:NKG2-C type II integral membrane protein-like n=1 Tax=Talpa occidentalis TaxID=50954 RepID=UPI0023F9E616|nr:NKG2-C type II integral membrane protein-like [Talpa occidentalis]